MLIIVIAEGPDKGRVFEFADDAVVTVGRHRGEIALNDVSVSRRHVQIARNEEGWYCRDLGSKHGTNVGGKTVRDDAAWLHNGCRIAVGKTLLVFTVAEGVPLSRAGMGSAAGTSAGAAANTAPRLDSLPRIERLLHQVLDGMPSPRGEDGDGPGEAATATGAGDGGADFTEALAALNDKVDALADQLATAAREQAAGEKAEPPAAVDEQTRQALSDVLETVRTLSTAQEQIGRRVAELTAKLEAAGPDADAAAEQARALREAMEASRQSGAEAARLAKEAREAQTASAAAMAEHAAAMGQQAEAIQRKLAELSQAAAKPAEAVDLEPLTQQVRESLNKAAPRRLLRLMEQVLEAVQARPAGEAAAPDLSAVTESLSAALGERDAQRDAELDRRLTALTRAIEAGPAEEDTRQRLDSIADAVAAGAAIDADALARQVAQSVRAGLGDEVKQLTAELRQALADAGDRGDHAGELKALADRLEAAINAAGEQRETKLQQSIDALRTELSASLAAQIEPLEDALTRADTPGPDGPPTHDEEDLRRIAEAATAQATAALRQEVAAAQRAMGEQLSHLLHGEMEKLRQKVEQRDDRLQAGAGAASAGAAVSGASPNGDTPTGEEPPRQPQPADPFASPSPGTSGGVAAPALAPASRQELTAVGSAFHPTAWRPPPGQTRGDWLRWLGTAVLLIALTLGIWFNGWLLLQEQNVPPGGIVPPPPGNSPDQTPTTGSDAGAGIAPTPLDGTGDAAAASPAGAADAAADTPQAAERSQLLDRRGRLMDELETLRRTRGPTAPATLAVLRQLADTEWQLGDNRSAESRLMDVRAGWATHESPDADELILTLSTLYDLRMEMGKGGEAQAVGQDLLKLQQEHLGPDDPRAVHTAWQMAHHLAGRGELASAEALFRQVYDARRRRLGEDDPETVSACRDLIDVLTQQGQTREAGVLRSVLDARREWAVQRSLRGADDARTAEAGHRLAMLLEQSGQAEAAGELIRTTLPGYRALAGSPDASRTHLLREAAEAARRLLGDDDPATTQLRQHVSDPPAPGEARANGT